jgi:hypothetical protein
VYDCGTGVLITREMTPEEEARIPEPEEEEAESGTEGAAG